MRYHNPFNCKNSTDFGSRKKTSKNDHRFSVFQNCIYLKKLLVEVCLTKIKWKELYFCLYPKAKSIRWNRRGSVTVMKNLGI